MNASPKLQAALLLAVCCAPGIASAASGKVLFTLGRVEIQRHGALIPVARGMPVEAGDQVDLGPTGRTQIRMNDGALIALLPGSSFVIEEYELPQGTEPVQVGTPTPRPATGASGRALFSLLKGGFRTITGLIGKGDQDVYQLKTPVATIGIRGTDHSATYCDGNCGPVPNGLYVGVSNGGIVVTNNAGSQTFGDNQYGYVQDSNTPPEQTLQPPAGILNPPIEDTGEDDDTGDEGGPTPSGEAGGTGEQGGGQGDDQGGSGDTGDGGGDFADAGGDGGSEPPPPDVGDAPPPPPPPPPPPEVPGSEPDPTAAGARFVAHSTGPLLGTPAFAGVAFDSADVVKLGPQGELIGFRSSAPVTGGVADYSAVAEQNVNQGFHETTHLRWGRWSTGVANVVDVANADSHSQDLTNQSLHWIYGPESFQPQALPSTGTATYQLVGNTDPTDNLGHIGFLGSASFSACFSCSNTQPNGQSGLGTVQSTLDLSVNSQVWSASGTGTIFTQTPLFAGNYSSVSVDGNAQGTSGSFAGFFTGPSGMPAGAGLAYTLVNGSATVSGAAAFGSPQAP